MKLKVKKISFETGNQKDVVLNSKDAERIGQKAGERIVVKNIESNSIDQKYWVGIVRIDYAGTLISEGEIGIFSDTLRAVAEEDFIENVSVKPADPPDSFKFIQKKVKGEQLTSEEINKIVDDAVSGHLSEIDLAAFITSVSINELNNKEMTALTIAETKSGNVFDFGPKVFDKHSTGGVPGNKVSLVIVPIVAAAGLTIPKTSTRAITSPSGTADSMEVLAEVAFESEELKQLVSEVNACIVWGGALDTSPADNVLISVERPLHMDPVGLMIPSILCKKKSMGVKKLVLDIPVGEGTKFKNVEEGKKFALLFKEIAKNVGIEAQSALTYAHQPVGHKVGPALEAKEALQLLQDYSAGPNSLIEKSTSLAGIIFEMSGKIPQGEGQKKAKKILKSGKAYEKMQEIIEAQGGDPDITPDEIELGGFKKDFYSKKEGFITQVDNSIINQISKTLGCPFSKKSGIDINKKQGGKIEKGERLLTMYSDSQDKLKRAEKIFNATGGPIILGGMVIERV